MADSIATFSLQSYVKMMLHSFKYPHRLVNGILLCDKSKNKKIIDCIPLFHVNPQLSPMLEVALLQIDGYCKRNDYEIFGYYQANEIVSDVNPSGLAYRICSKIKENNKHGILVMLNIDHSDLENEMIDVYTMDGQNWKKVEKTTNWVEGNNLKNILKKLIEINGVQVLIDFDNHLDNLKFDWKNHLINETLKKIIKC